MTAHTAWFSIQSVPSGCYVLLWEHTEWSSRPHIHWFTTDGEAKAAREGNTVYKLWSPLEKPRLSSLSVIAKAEGAGSD